MPKKFEAWVGQKQETHRRYMWVLIDADAGRVIHSLDGTVYKLQVRKGADRFRTIAACVTREELRGHLLATGEVFDPFHDALRSQFLSEAVEQLPEWAIDASGGFYLSEGLEREKAKGPAQEAAVSDFGPSEGRRRSRKGGSRSVGDPASSVVGNALRSGERSKVGAVAVRGAGDVVAFGARKAR